MPNGEPASKIPSPSPSPSGEPPAPIHEPVPKLVVDLTTLGNPLMLLAEHLPFIYGRKRPDGGHRSMPAVVRWRNYYFDQDIIGRRLDPALSVPSTAPWSSSPLSPWATARTPSILPIPAARVLLT